MSRVIQGGVKKALSGDAERWQRAIDYAGVLYARENDAAKRKRLEAAIQWFKHRMETGAPYLVYCAANPVT